MTNFETIKKQAVAIMLREKHERDTRETAETPTLIMYSAADIPPPPPGKRAVKAWAELAAPQITFDEWSDIAYHCADTVKPFRGCVISFMECAFDGLQMKDGSRVWA